MTDKRTGRPPKYGKTMTQKFFVRLPAEYFAIMQNAGGTATFSREVLATVYQAMLAVKAGKITPDEFRAQVGDQLLQKIVEEQQIESKKDAG